mmetsp:Transcript_41667/g.87228  ORF Transcript_41667/g.87228 Transcript_41667/m.87228 type:complete len:527 (+) Transcript_41667:13-1593(+)
MRDRWQGAAVASAAAWRRLDARARTRYGSAATVGMFLSSKLAYEGARSVYEPPPPGYVLGQVIVVLRHGDRAPISRTAGELTCDERFWCGTLPSAETCTTWDNTFPIIGPATAYDAGDAPFGMLTREGADQCFRLGIELRARLEAHAPHLLNPAGGGVHARSTNLRRTQQSAQSLLFGLLAADREGADAASQSNQVVHVREMAEETLVPNPQRCPRLRVLLKRSSQATLGELDSDVDFKHRIAASLGYEGETMRVDQAREVLICMLAHSHKAGAAPLPDGISSEDVVRLTELNARRWCARFSDPVMSQLAMGPFLAEVRALLSATVESSPASSTRRRGAGGVHVVCGHDTTLVPLLCAMGAFEGGWPRYAANLTIELALAAPAPAAGPCGYGTGAEVVETGVVRASEATAARSPRNATPALLPEEGRSRALVRVLYDGATVQLPSAKKTQIEGWLPWQQFRESVLKHAVEADAFRDLCRTQDVSASEEGGAEGDAGQCLQDNLKGSSAAIDAEDRKRGLRPSKSKL